jgi:hypothetical protein
MIWLIVLEITFKPLVGRLEQRNYTGVYCSETPLYYSNPLRKLQKSELRVKRKEERGLSVQGGGYLATWLPTVRDEVSIYLYETSFTVHHYFTL